MRKLRFGFLGTANIARKNWRSIHDSGNAIVAAVASRDAGRAWQYIKELQAETPFETVPTALGSYEELLASKNIDVVYIPLPTGLRKEWVLRAAAAGRHVICEKPCGLNAADVQEMIGACKKKSRAVHGRRDVHAQSANEPGSQISRRRQKHRPGQTSHVQLQFSHG